ncbi:zinc finger and BTB domain-containing protein 4-like [Mustelus asterias]
MASGFEVVDRSHCKVLLHELNEQRIQGIFCDVTIVVQDSKFKAHKNILAAFSRYFKELLASQGLWAMEPVFELREMKAEIFAKILNFIYSSRVVVERREEADDLASAGHRLGIHFLKELLDVSPQTGTSDHRLPSSVQSSLSQSPDPPRVPAKEGHHRSRDFQDDVPLGLWPRDSPFPPDALVGPTFPIDLTAPASQRRPGEADRPLPAAYRSPSPESGADHPAEHSGSEREGSEPRPRREGCEIRADDCSSLDGLFQADFLKGASRDAAEEVHEAAKRLYTLSTAAFRGLGFNVEESANPVVVPPPPKEPAAPAAEEPGAAWVQPPVPGSPEEEAGSVTETLTTPSAGYRPGVLSCGLCARSFSTVAALSLHSKLHRPGKALSCRHCRKSFVHVKRLHTHQTLCRRSDGARSPGGRRRSLTGPTLDLLLAESGGGAGGRKLGALSRIDPLTEEEHFMKVIDGHLLYFCAVCERSYVTLSSLKRHANVHSWRRKYPCRYCDKVFALAEYRTKHEVWHTGERRYQCIFCWETFVTYYNLKTHQKSFHGVDPGLTISQKTPNGGYKPKLNAFKLYRLLPMRSQKRPYKTYSHTVSAELLKFAQRAPLPDNDLATLSQPPPAKHDQGEGPDEGRHSPERQAAPSVPDTLRGPPPGESPPLPVRDGGSPRRGFSGCRAAAMAASGEGPPPQPPPPPASSLFPAPEGAAAAPSVITYGRPAPSVIVHSNALLPTLPQRAQSSVIAYNGRCPRGEEEEEEGVGASARQPCEAPPSPPGRPAKRPSSRDPPPPEKATSACPATANQRHQRQKEPRSQKPKRHLLLPARGKAVTYVAKPACAGAAAESRGAPLCQITMRIGEEAIVKRRISESDLIRDKDGGGKGRRRSEGSQTGGKRNGPEGEAGGSRRRSHYFLGNESGEEVSDNDIDDNLWRPYYSYKPKRRPGGFHKTKKSGWRRKLRYRHSPRWLQRAAKGPDREERPEPMDCRPPEPDEDQDGGQQLADPSQPGCSSSSSPVTPRQGAQGAFTCPACGEEFSTLRSLRKHGECHPESGQPACRSCDGSFGLVKGPRKPEETHGGHGLWPPPPPPAAPPQEAPRPPPPHGDARRAAGRHACAHCPKTCKTAAALGRHQKRHLAGQRPGAPGTGQGQNGGLTSETFGQLERASRGALRPSTPEEEEEDCLPRGDRNGVTGTPSASEGENLKLLQRKDHLPTITPYTEVCSSGARVPEPEMCPLLHHAQNPTHLPGRETPGQELAGPTGIPLGPMHQLMLAQGAESRRAETPVSRGIYSDDTTGGAPQEQEVLPLTSRVTGGQCVPGPPATEGEAQDGMAMPRAEDDGEGLPLRDAGDEVREFHTLEAMGAREAAGFEESGHGLELARDSEYPAQEYPLPLLTSGNCRLQTGLEGKALAFHPGASRFKEGGEDLSKVAFYQDPYQLVYGHQLLAGAYPYNFAHISPLPVALNMVIRDEKGQQLPLLHRMFVYPPTTPCRDEAAPTLLAPPPPPPLGAAGNGSRDDAARELLAGEKGTSMY